MDVPVGEAHRAGYEVVIKKIESYRVTHKGVKPVTPRKGGSLRPGIGTLFPGRGGLFVQRVP